MLRPFFYRHLPLYQYFVDSKLSEFFGNIKVSSILKMYEGKGKVKGKGKGNGNFNGKGKDKVKGEVKVKVKSRVKVKEK